MSSIPRPDPRFLKLYDGENEGPEPDDHGRLTKHITLGEFFERWFLPVVLEAEDVSLKTIGLYRDSLRWWRTLTDDPPLHLIDEYTVATFATGLRAAQWSRGKTGEARTLGKWTIAKHLKNVRTVLRRTGPTMHPERPGKGLIEMPPHIKVASIRGKPKPCFALARARAIVSAAGGMDCPLIPGLPPDLFWRGLLATMFYAGLRSGTVLKLEWPMYVDRDDGAWLIVPGEIVDKTDKPIDVAVHRQLAEVLAQIRERAGARRLMFPWPHSYTHLVAQHERLQTLAGVPEAQQLSPQAWRRTHGTEMARLGAKHAIEVARQSLDHADSKTTTGFYVNVLAELMRKLPSPIFSSVSSSGINCSTSRLIGDPPVRVAVGREVWPAGGR